MDVATDTRTSTPTLPAQLALGPVTIAVRDLGRSINFYTGALGMQVIKRTDEEATVGAGAPVLHLVEDRDARPAGRHAGLFHVAINYPTRIELAHQINRLAAYGALIEGASNHHTHEAVYLSDPDGNGLELAWDLPREQWISYDQMPGGGRPDALDMRSVLALVNEQSPREIAQDMRVGHLHLHVGSVAAALVYYTGVLGFELQANMGSAAFVSAGGYHHHLAFNVWKGEGVPAQPAGVVGLREWQIQLPTTRHLEQVRARLEGAGYATRDSLEGFSTIDPWGMQISFVADRTR